MISACGVLSPDDPSLVPSEATLGDSHEDYPEDDDSDVQNPEVALDIARQIRELSNKLFKDGQVGLALNKYLSEPSCRPHLFVSLTRYQNRYDIWTCTLCCRKTLHLNSGIRMIRFWHPFC